MGYALCTSACISCNRVFSYNPVRVPSIIHKGNREPICAPCVERYNPLRKAKGLPLIVPAADAYEACDENEL